MPILWCTQMRARVEKVDMLIWNQSNFEFRISVSREHVREVQRTIRNINDHGRGIFNTLPYSYLPSHITINLIYFIVMWFNELLAGKGIYPNYSPREIVIVCHLEFKKHRRLVRDSYVEAHDDPHITNNMAPRTHECIALAPTKNVQVAQKVFCLDSVKFIKRRNIIPMVSRYQIIKRVDGWVGKPRRYQYGKVVEIRNSNK